MYAGRGAWVYGLVGGLVPWGPGIRGRGRERGGVGSRGGVGDGEGEGEGLSDIGEVHSDGMEGSWRDGAVVDSEGEGETGIGGESAMWEKVRGAEDEMAA